MKHQKNVSISSCTVHDKISEMCQFLVVQYTMTHQKYVPVFSCTVHVEHEKYVPVSVDNT